MALIGSAVGLVGSLAVARFLAAANPSMHLSSPLVLAGTTLVLIGGRARCVMAARTPCRAQ